MFDNIEIISLLLCLLALVAIIFGVKDRQYVSVVIFMLVGLLALMWAGLVRLPIPQSLVWIGVNVFALIFTLKGLLGLISMQAKSLFFQLPVSIINPYEKILSILIGFGFIAIILLARL